MHVLLMCYAFLFAQPISSHSSIQPYIVHIYIYIFHHMSLIMYMGTLREHTHIYIYIFKSLYIYVYTIRTYFYTYILQQVQKVTRYQAYRYQPQNIPQSQYVSVLVGANVIDVKQHEVWLACLTGKELKPAKQQWMKFRGVQESISQFWISRS